MATLVDLDTTAGTIEHATSGDRLDAAPLASVEERRRELHRRGRTARLRQWISAASMSGAALALITITLFSLIGH